MKVVLPEGKTICSKLVLTHIALLHCNTQGSCPPAALRKFQNFEYKIILTFPLVKDYCDMGKDQLAANGLTLWQHHLHQNLPEGIAGDRKGIFLSADRSSQVDVRLGRGSGGVVLSCWS